MTSNGTLDTVQQHHYQNMYRHHQQHLGSSPVDPRIFATPPPRVYSSGEGGLVHIDSYLSQHLPSKGIKKTIDSSVQRQVLHLYLQNMILISEHLFLYFSCQLYTQKKFLSPSKKSFPVLSSIILLAYKKK